MAWKKSLFLHHIYNTLRLLCNFLYREYLHIFHMHSESRTIHTDLQRNQTNHQYFCNPVEFYAHLHKHNTHPQQLSYSSQNLMIQSKNIMLEIPYRCRMDHSKNRTNMEYHNILQMVQGKQMETESGLDWMLEVWSSHSMMEGLYHQYMQFQQSMMQLKRFLHTLLETDYSHNYRFPKKLTLLRAFFLDQ